MSILGATALLGAASRSDGGGLSYFEAPVFLDADWGQRSTLTHAVTYPDGGTTMVLSNESGPNYSQAEQGYTDYTRYECYESHSPKPDEPLFGKTASYIGGVITHESQDFYRIVLVWNEVAFGDPGDIRLAYVDNGTVYTEKIGSTIYDPKDIAFTFDVDAVNGDIYYDITFTDYNDDTQVFSGVYAGCYFNSETYYPFESSSYNEVTVTGVKVYGTEAV